MPSIYSNKMNDWNNQTTITSSCDLWLNGSTFCHSTMTRGSIFYTGAQMMMICRSLAPLSNQSVLDDMFVLCCLMTLSIRTSSPSASILFLLSPQTVVRLIPKQTSTITLGPLSTNRLNFEEISTTHKKDGIKEGHVRIWVCAESEPLSWALEGLHRMSEGTSVERKGQFIRITASKVPTWNQDHCTAL